MENVELISQLTIEDWQREIAKVKSVYPDHPLWASIMAAPVRDEWQRLVEAIQETGIDAFELNVSCPHGMTGNFYWSER
jgi:dihydroorotate dehydrogenase